MMPVDSRPDLSWCVVVTRWARACHLQHVSGLFSAPRVSAHCVRAPDHDHGESVKRGCGRGPDRGGRALDLFDQDGLDAAPL